MSDHPSTTPAADPYAAWRSPDYRLFAGSWFAMMFAKQIETVAVGIHIYEPDPRSAGTGLGRAGAGPAGDAAGHSRRPDRRPRQSPHGDGGDAGRQHAGRAGPGAGLGRPSFAPLDLWALDRRGGEPGLGESLAGGASCRNWCAGPHFSNAVTWSTTVFHIASMTGPAIGGLSDLPLRQTAVAFAVVVLCRLVSLSAILAAPQPAPQRSAESISWNSLAAGRPLRLENQTDPRHDFARFVRRALGWSRLFAADLRQGHSSRRRLRAGLPSLGGSRGAVSTAMLIAHLTPFRRAGRTMLWAVAGFGAATIVFGLSQWFWLSLAMMF